jgi:ATP-dependent DNA helicase Rep
MQELLNKLNPAQQEAVRYTKGPLLVLAGAGSGKTRVITHKIAYLIQQCGIQAKHITAITFTNKAAREMQERATKLIVGLNTRGLTICTFHALGLKILREEAKSLGYKSTFSVLDSYDSGKIISDILQTTDKALIRNLQSQISLWKNSFINPDQAFASAADEVAQLPAKFYQQYQDTLLAYQAIDFDDLIKLPVELFSRDLAVLHKWQLKIRYLLVDEYQDTNVCQYQLIRLLAGSLGQFTAVGDDDQSIYAWRGANSENLSLLNQDYSQLKIIKLEQNYRSTSTILNAANALIKNNPKMFEKKLWSEYGMGAAIRIISCPNEEAEADAVARKIVLHQLNKSSKFSEYAILYRSNFQARILEQALRNYKIPYTIAGGQSFFDKAEIKDIMSYLRLLINDTDDTAFIRALTTPKRGVGEATLNKLGLYAAKREISLYAALFEEGFAAECPPAQLNNLLEFGQFIQTLQQRMLDTSAGVVLNQLITAIGYEGYLYDNEEVKAAEKRFANVMSFIDWLAAKGERDNKSLPELIQTVALISMLEGQEEEEVEAVRLTTLHASKGLEYPYVFLVSCEEGILPHQESISGNSIEEERRLMYVGVTRAQYELTISYCEKRRKAGAVETRERSRFLAELGEQNIVDEAKRKFEKIKDKEELVNKFSLLKALLRQ